MDENTTGATHDDAATGAGGAAPRSGEEPTRVMPGAADEATRVMPAGAAEAPTRVIPRAGEEPTRVMPGAGGAPPTHPPVTMTRGGAPPSRTWLWVALAALAVIVVALLAWLLFLRGEDGGEFAGTWARTDGTPGGLVITQNGDSYTVKGFDSRLEPAGTAEATLSGGRLEFALPPAAFGLPATEGTVQAEAIYEEPSDTLTVRALSAGGTGMTMLEYVRTDVLVPATPAPAPTPTPTPTPTASPSPSGSPGADSDQQVIDRIVRLQVGILTWATNNGNVYPAPADVAQGGAVAQYVDPWPTNPYTNAPMAPGTQPGDFSYEQLNGGQAYRLTGFLSQGQTHVVP